MYNEAYAKIQMALNVVNTSAYNDENQNIELLDSIGGKHGGTVAGEDQPPQLVIPDREAEHPLELANRVGAEALVQRDNRLDVPGRAEPVAGLCARATQLGGVIDLAVAHHPHRAVQALERLVAGREVHDGEPARPDLRPRVPHDLLAVGPAVRQCGCHRSEAVGVPQRLPGERHCAEDPAHQPPRPFALAGAHGP